MSTSRIRSVLLRIGTSTLACAGANTLTGGISGAIGSLIYNSKDALAERVVMGMLGCGITGIAMGATTSAILNSLSDVLAEAIENGAIYECLGYGSIVFLPSFWALNEIGSIIGYLALHSGSSESLASFFNISASGTAVTFIPEYLAIVTILYQCWKNFKPQNDMLNAEPNGDRRQLGA